MESIDFGGQYCDVNGRRYMAADHRQRIDIWGRLRPKCIIEVVDECGTVQIVETPREEPAIATIALRL